MQSRISRIIKEEKLNNFISILLETSRNHNSFIISSDYNISLQVYLVHSKLSQFYIQFPHYGSIIL